MESFGNAVVASKAPHSGDLLAPGVQGFAKLDQLRETSLAQLMNGAQQARYEFFALPARAVFLQQQVTEPSSAIRAPVYGNCGGSCSTTGAGRNPRLVKTILGDNVLTESEILLGLPDLQITGIQRQEGTVRISVRHRCIRHRRRFLDSRGYSLAGRNTATL